MSFYVSILHNAHVQMTLSDPICMNEYDVPVESKSIVDYPNLLPDAFEKFKKRPLPYGTVHIDPAFWFSVFKQSYEKHQKVLKVPNGCCNQNHCPVKLFYQDLLDTLNDYMIWCDIG